VRTRLRIGIVAAFVILGFATSPTLSAAASTAKVAAVKVTAVTFTGSATGPVLTIRGSGFGTEPTASPSGPPYRYQPGCTAQAPLGNKNDGHDYGAQALWVGWGHVQAGAYVKGVGGYLDCVGLVVKKYSADEIVISPGCQYGYYAKLSSGTTVTVTVSGHRFVTKVRYS
jgi:hypothetical protein